MTRLRRRIAKETGEPIRTDKGGASRKLEELLQRARMNGAKQGPLVPVEALINVERDDIVLNIPTEETIVAESNLNVSDDELINNNNTQTEGLSSKV